MDDVQKMHARMQCLDLAVQVCKMTSDAYSVVSRAEEYWSWLDKENILTPVGASKNSNDIPF